MIEDKSQGKIEDVCWLADEVVERDDAIGHERQTKSWMSKAIRNSLDDTGQQPCPC